MQSEVGYSKYGFVYIWFDRHRKMFYVGCHWGYEDDGYRCSSKRMDSAYRRRPHDFKRRILNKIYTNRADLLEEEFKWLNQIKEEELGKRYYNLRKRYFGHWVVYDQERLDISQKISIKTKEAMQRPEVKQRYLDSLPQRNKSLKKTCSQRPNYKWREKLPKFGSEEYRKNMRDKWTSKFENFTEEEKIEHKLKMKQQAVDFWNSLSEAEKLEWSKKSSERQKGKSCPSKGIPWWTNGKENKRQMDQPSEGWYQGRTTKKQEFSDEERKKRSDRIKIINARKKRQ